MNSHIAYGFLARSRGSTDCQNLLTSSHVSSTFNEALIKFSAWMMSRPSYFLKQNSKSRGETSKGCIGNLTSVTSALSVLTMNKVFCSCEKNLHLIALKEKEKIYCSQNIPPLFVSLQLKTEHKF